MAVADRLYEPQTEPTWDIAHLFPSQGEWSVSEYLSLEGNHLVEYDDGHVEILPMPSPKHQRIVFFLQRILWTFISQRNLGEVLSAPLPVELWTKKFREPDLIYVSASKLDSQADSYWSNVDLVIEVVSPDKPSRDYETKRSEYAQAGIPEYWIVDPMKMLITVLELSESEYSVHGEFRRGQEATSTLLAGFSVSVDDVFDTG